jgi:hypothetical protein
VQALSFGVVATDVGVDGGGRPEHGALMSFAVWRHRGKVLHPKKAPCGPLRWTSTPAPQVGRALAGVRASARRQRVVVKQLGDER